MRDSSRQIEARQNRFLIITGYVLALIVSWSTAFADDSAVDLDPLRPADTSSPRDTLHSFLENTDQVIKDIRGDTVNKKTQYAYRRATETFDFSGVPEGDSWYVRNRSTALLQELLARLELPPEKDIPGDDEVADGTILEWTIPNTSIKISKIQQGPRSGEFLFSSDTIRKLESLYRQVKELPYRPGSTPGIYEEMVSADNTVQKRESILRDLLRPLDTSSPRATLQGFLDNVNRAYVLVTEVNEKLRAKPPTMTREEAREKEKSALDFLERAGDGLDLSQVPNALRKSFEIQAVLQLKEILDRMLLPPIETVPDIRMIKAAQKEASGDPSKAQRALRWRFPIVQFEIVEMMSGNRQGQFLFSADTVNRINDVYEKIKYMPYRQEHFGGTELEYLSPGRSPDFYESYVAASGNLIPQAHLVPRLVSGLPEWFHKRYAGQLVWQWIGLVLSMLSILLAAYGINKYLRLLVKRMKSPLQVWLKFLVPILVLSVVIIVSGFVDDELSFTGEIAAVVTTGFRAVIYLLMAWVVYVSFKAIADTIAAAPKLRDRGSEVALMRIGARVFGFLTAIWIIVAGLRDLGADLIPLLAGLGIGGFAVALAAQSTIANFIGGLILLANKPVRVGDFCRYGEDPSQEWLRIGTVEEINWISTRIRGIDRTVTTIPNAEFANMHIVNLTKRDERLMRTTLRLRYETTGDQLRFILIKIRELLLGHPMVTPNPARVRFLSYAEYSKNIEIFCYLRCREQNDFLAIQEDVLLHIEDIVKAAGSGFAWPTHTAYIARDPGTDAERKEQAEAEVGHRRFTGKLPFPEFDEEERVLLEDTVDYPPKGSPDYVPR